MSDANIIELESKLSHQEFLISQLKELVLEQGMAIYQLESKLTLMDKKFQEVVKEDIGPAGQKPPHY